jgi:hypothetical protein
MIARDPAEVIRRALALMHDPAEVVELRALLTRRGTQSGFYRDRDALVEDALHIEAEAAGVYFTLNTIDPALYSRARDRLQPAFQAVTDADVQRRQRILIDADPVRPAGVSSNATEHDAALARVEEIRGWVLEQGAPGGGLVSADSGNGAHLLIACDLGADDSSDQLVRDVLSTIAERFSDEVVKIDRAVGNRARISRLYGTLARKGEPTPARPHRRSGLLTVPDRVTHCPIAVLESIAALAPPERPRLSSLVSLNSHQFRTAIRDLGAWIEEKLEILARREKPDGTIVWVVRCPWRQHSERNRAAYVTQRTDGAITAGCHHADCVGENWQTLKAILDPTVAAVEAALLAEMT